MATGLVKWWRARFLAGYKPFSVVGGTADGSDSEELLACVAPPCNSSPLPPRILITPEPSLHNGANPIQSTTSTTTTPQTANDDIGHPNNVGNPTRQLSFEEFECDVSVAEGDRRRQEFSFTLYDFDGHGKITKDDIAGLVTTIYDTLGASIQVPPCGSKTIKVKLTVSPDQRATSLGSSNSQQQQQANSSGATTGPTNAGATKATGFLATGITTATASTTATGTATVSNTSVKTTHLPAANVPTGIATTSSSCCHVKHVSSCSHGNHHSRRAPRRRRALRTRPEPERVVESHSDEDGDNVPAGLTTVNGATTTTGVTPSPTKQEELRRRVGPVAHMPAASPYSNSSEGDVSDESDASPTITPLTPLVTNQRKRSGSMQRQQLLEIIQANMEKNNLSFHASRKRHQSEQLRIPVQSPYVVEPTSPYIERCKPSLGSRQPTAYHKPVREHHHHHHSNHQHPTVPLAKLPVKCRSGGNARKQRGQNSSSPRAAPPQSLRNNLQQTTIEDNVNINCSPTHNNLEQQPLIVNQTANINNHINNQHNETHYVQSQQSGKPGKKHQLKHATREQDQARAMAQVVRWLEREFSQNSAVSSTAGRRHVHKHIHHHYHHYHAEALV